MPDRATTILMISLLLTILVLGQALFPKVRELMKSNAEKDRVVRVRL